MPELLAPIAGRVIAVRINTGDRIAEDQEVMVVEALKMQMPVYADASGTVKEIKVQVGDQVEQGAVLALLE
jgi:acetyl-CoA carboxylase biotin carboxyl carrier protein